MDPISRTTSQVTTTEQNNQNGLQTAPQIPEYLVHRRKLAAFCQDIIHGKTDTLGRKISSGIMGYIKVKKRNYDPRNDRYTLQGLLVNSLNHFLVYLDNPDIPIRYCRDLLMQTHNIFLTNAVKEALGGNLSQDVAFISHGIDLLMRTPIFDNTKTDEYDVASFEARLNELSRKVDASEELVRLASNQLACQQIDTSAIYTLEEVLRLLHDKLSTADSISKISTDPKVILQKLINEAKEKQARLVALVNEWNLTAPQRTYELEQLQKDFAAEKAARAEAARELAEKERALQSAEATQKQLTDKNQELLKEKEAAHQFTEEVTRLVEVVYDRASVAGSQAGLSTASTCRNQETLEKLKFVSKTIENLLDGSDAAATKVIDWQRATMSNNLGPNPVFARNNDFRATNSVMSASSSASGSTSRSVKAKEAPEVFYPERLGKALWDDLSKIMKDGAKQLDNEAGAARLYSAVTQSLATFADIDNPECQLAKRKYQEKFLEYLRKKGFLLGSEYDIAKEYVNPAGSTPSSTNSSPVLFMNGSG